MEGSLVRPRAVVSLTVDEEGRRSVDAAPNAAPEVVADLFCINALLELPRDAVGVETKLAGISDQVGVLECVLVLEDHVVHLPVLPLRSSGFGDLGGMVRVRVRLLEREVS